MSIVKEIIYDYLNTSRSGDINVVYNRARTDVWMQNPVYRDIFPWGSVILYYILLQILPKLVKKKVPFIKPVMAFWNGFLALLSMAMFYGVFKRFVERWIEVGLFDTLCSDHLCVDPNPIMYWAYIFCKSKYLELFDTLWMILNKKEVPFLHWWHHITVLLFTWYATYWNLSVGIVFIFVNALVHSFMYTYYFLMSIGYKPSWAKYLTIGQISQMVLGTFLNVWFFYNKYIAGIHCNCDRPDLLVVACGLMFGSYFILFLQFYIKRYYKKRDAKAIADKKKQ
eukprot:gene442-6855_t